MSVLILGFKTHVWSVEIRGAGECKHRYSIPIVTRALSDACVNRSVQAWGSSYPLRGACDLTKGTSSREVCGLQSCLPAGLRLAPGILPYGCPQHLEQSLIRTRSSEESPRFLSLEASKHVEAPPGHASKCEDHQTDNMLDWCLPEEPLNLEWGEMPEGVNVSSCPTFACLGELRRCADWVDRIVVCTQGGHCATVVGTALGKGPVRDSRMPLARSWGGGSLHS